MSQGTNNNKRLSLDDLLDNFKQERRNISADFLVGKIEYDEYKQKTHDLTIQYYKLVVDIPA